MEVFDCSRNVLKVDEPSQLLTVETSLRMTWKDSRLSISLPGDYPTSYIRFGNNVMSYIWIPDVYIDGVQDLRSPAYKVDFTKNIFLNEIQTLILRIDTSFLIINNYFQLTPAYLRVYNTSKLKYSARVNYDVACPMTFEEYPVDTQRCNISLESWGHPSEVIDNISWAVSFLIKIDLYLYVG